MFILLEFCSHPKSLKRFNYTVNVQIPGISHKICACNLEISFRVYCNILTPVTCPEVSSEPWCHLMRWRTSDDSSVISPSLCRRQGSISRMRSIISTRAQMAIRAYAIIHITGSLRDAPAVQSDATPWARKGPEISANGTPLFSDGMRGEVIMNKAFNIEMIDVGWLGKLGKVSRTFEFTWNQNLPCSCWKTYAYAG